MPPSGNRYCAEMEVRALTWNLFHGRDHAPDPSLHSWRSRLLRITERNDTHAQVNRDLFEEFASVLCDAEWDVALLQECPPRWAEALATACDAEPHLVLTSRNLPPLVSTLQRIAAGINPDLLASWEGGCNLTLVRAEQHGTPITDREAVTLARQPETRRMALTRLDSGLCVANLHASKDRRDAEQEVERAAAEAVEWANGAPLIFGGDLNLRPASSAALFEALERSELLEGATAPDAIDHLLGRGLDRIEAARAWPVERREVEESDVSDDRAPRSIRLSDHAPVEALFGVPVVAG